MADPYEQDYDMDDVDEDEILAGLSAEELKELQNEMDVLAPDDRVPVGMRQKNSEQRRPVKDESDHDSDCEDIDEDQILAGLSAEELKELQKEMDVIAPDERVPVGMRQRDQTEKAPTGNFDRRSLVDYLYWEKESKRMLEEERVPVTLLPSEKKLQEAAEQKEKEQQVVEEVVEVVEVEEEVPEGVEEVEYIYEEVVEEVVAEDGQVGEEVIEEVIEEIIEEVVEEVEPEPEKRQEEENKQQQATSKVNNNNIFSTLMAEVKDATQQPPVEEKKEAAVTKDQAANPTPPQQPLEEMQSGGRFENWVPEKEERVINKLKIPKLALPGGLGGIGGGGGGGGLKLTSRPSGNETNLDTTLHKVRNNNPAVTDVNLNNIENIPKEMLVDYVNALKKNKHVKTFSIANTGADENIGFCLANMLRENKSITTLNIESNFITGKGIIAIIRCLQFNETLTELRFHNQRHMLGHHAEMEVSRLLKANNTLLKMGYHFELPGPRMVVTNLLTRNLDRQRQQRHEEQKQKDQQQQRDLMEMYSTSLNLPPGLLQMLGAYMPPEELLAQLQKHHEMQQQQDGEGEEEEEEDEEEQQAAQYSRKPSSSSSSSSSQPGLVMPQLRKTHNLHKDPAGPKASGADAAPGSIIKDVHLKKTPKKRDPFLDQCASDEPVRTSFQLRRAAQCHRSALDNRDAALQADERANLKGMLKTLKPVPRHRVPPKVEMTPRDKLLNEIKQSNVAYLKATPLPKELESSQTTLASLLDL